MLLLYPFREGEQYFQYDPVTHLATLHNDPARAHMVSSCTVWHWTSPNLYRSVLQAAYVNASVLLTTLRRLVEQLHGANAGRYKVTLGKGPLTYTWSQILHRVPKAWFRPVGQVFINVYNQRFNGHLGPEWAGRSMANILYHCVISFHNYSHPCFDKTAPAQLQVNLDPGHY